MDFFAGNAFGADDNEARWLQTTGNFTSPTFLPSESPSMAPSVTAGCLNITTTGPTVSDVDAIRNALRVYGSIYAICFFIFCILRTRFPKIYQVRSWSPYVKIDLAKIGYSSIDWFYKLWWINDDEFRKQCGMDALCFIRMLRFGLQISFVGMVNSLWLLPTYGTAKFSKETAQVTDHLEMVTVAHLPPGSNRFFATVIAAYILFGSIMYLLLNEFQWFTDNRHKFLSSKRASNYTVYVSHIPLEYRSSHKLLDYFRSCYSHDAVLEAHVTLDIPQLESKVAAREGVISRLEHAINVEEVTGTAPTHVDILHGGKTVNTIEALSNELKELNGTIKDRVEELEAMHDPQSFKKDVESNGGTLKAPAASGTGDSVSELHMEDPLTGSAMQKQNQQREVLPGSTEQQDASDPDNGSGHGGGMGAVGNIFNTVKSGAGGLAHMAIDLVDGEEEGTGREAGFVTFSKLSTTQSALQMIHHPTPFTMDVSSAPEPGKSITLAIFAVLIFVGRLQFLSIVGWFGHL